MINQKKQNSGEKYMVCKHCYASEGFKKMYPKFCEAKKHLEACEFIEEPICNGCGHGITSHTENGCNIGFCHGTLHKFSSPSPESEKIDKPYTVFDNTIKKIKAFKSIVKKDIRNKNKSQCGYCSDGFHCGICKCCRPLESEKINYLQSGKAQPLDLGKIISTSEKVNPFNLGTPAVKGYEMKNASTSTFDLGKTVSTSESEKGKYQIASDLAEKASKDLMNTMNFSTPESGGWRDKVSDIICINFGAANMASVMREGITDGIIKIRDFTVDEIIKLVDSEISSTEERAIENIRKVLDDEACDAGDIVTGMVVSLSDIERVLSDLKKK